MADLFKVKPRPRRPWLRWAGWAFLAGGCLASLLILFWLRHALYHRWVTFPRQKQAWSAIQADRIPVKDNTGWREYRGVLHSHSEHSHDCEVPFPEILRVLKETQREFIAMSDHCVEGRADFNLQWRGLHEGRLFIPGFEMKDGLMPFGAAPGTVLSNSMSGDLIAQQTVRNGGVLFYAHAEEPRVWERPELTGMELYNIHADLKASAGLGALLPEVLVNLSTYPDQVMRLLFRRPTANLARWDEMNKTRHIAGIAGNDCHQNTGVRIFYTDRDTLRIEDTSPRTIKELHLNGATRLLARAVFGPLEPGRKVFHLQLDPYERSVRFVTTHLLARQLAEPDLLDALRAGRAFIGFDTIADSTTFRWVARNANGQAVMGEALADAPGTRLRASSPHQCRFTVVKDGVAVVQAEGRDIEWTATGPGHYRVEAELLVVGEWVPWVYTNPIHLRAK